MAISYILTNLIDKNSIVCLFYVYFYHYNRFDLTGWLKNRLQNLDKRTCCCDTRSKYISGYEINRSINWSIMGFCINPVLNDVNAYIIY